MSYVLNLTKKTGFIVTQPNTPVNIRDDRGIMFYTTEPILPVYSFNLPAGKYFVDSGFFKAASKPIDFKLEKEPMAETAFAVPPLDFKITFAPNRDKCTIRWRQKLIIFDNRFRDAPMPELMFIYFHECGHSKYGFRRLYTMEEAEAFCDLYASNAMLRLGYNPSQIIKAPKVTLSEKQDYRKDYIRNTLILNANK